MKKIILVAAVVVVALAALGAGAVYAQGGQPPFGGNMMGGGRGWMHDYVEQALAAKLGITEQAVEDALASGKSMYQIALDAGTAEADIPALMNEVHKAAFDKAVADGVMTQAQADSMLQRMLRMQGNWAGGASGNCPMHNGTNGRTMARGFAAG